jgi:hypothetical protein
VAVDVDPMAATIPSSSTSSLLSPGDLLPDRYRIEETRGQGAMGTGYGLEHVRMHKRFALKVLDRGRSWTSAWTPGRTSTRCSCGCGDAGAGAPPRRAPYLGGGYSQRPSHGTLLQHCDALVQS